MQHVTMKTAASITMEFVPRWVVVSCYPNQPCTKDWVRVLCTSEELAKEIQRVLQDFTKKSLPEGPTNKFHNYGEVSVRRITSID